MLTTDQIAALEFGSLRRAQHRMAELYELGVVWRFRYPLLGGGSQPWRYTLGYAGARMMTATRGEDPPSPRTHQTRLERLAASPKLGHLLGVNDFFTQLASHARRAALRAPNTWRGEGLCRWLSEQQVCTHYEKTFLRNPHGGFNQPGSGLRMRPDGYGCWRARGIALAFYLEYDTGTEPLSRVAEKIERYVGRDDAEAELLEGVILFSLHSTRREQGLRAELARLPPTIMPIATTARDYGDPAGPAGPVWLLANPPPGVHVERCTLLQLARVIGTEPSGKPTVLERRHQQTLERLGLANP
ncbi:hypothetical protein GCM10023321_19370 [Pseudonocardia eucalypti]|uniref:Replication-relaxation n=1 Tax=Pseudonocardia eucalypti TaxID=648755 RepID=A0ABP9PT50_9PSEU